MRTRRPAAAGVREPMIRQRIALGSSAALVLLGLPACNTPYIPGNPYDPGQRVIGGALIGAGTGAVAGAIAGGGMGAAIGAAAGGVVGAVAGGVTTPSAPSPAGYPPPPPRL